MKKPSGKVAGIRAKTVIISAMLVSILFLCISGIRDIRQQTNFSNTFENCTKRLPQDKNYQALLDTNNIPCYQKALKAGHDLSMESMLASLLVKEGRYDDARPLYTEIAHPDVWGYLLCRGRTAEARRMLEPGGMEAERARIMRSDEAQRDLPVVMARNQQEESEFLKLHATMDGMRIVYMSEADKIVWLRMREQHYQQQRALARM